MPRSPGWQVLWHPKALEERDALCDERERAAANAVVDKLRVDGPALCFPHQSAVMGTGQPGLRELRPRRGRGRLRPIYGRLAPQLFAVLAVGLEVGIDKRRYDRAIRAAVRRYERLRQGVG